MRRDLKAIYNYCSWEAGRPCGNKQAWILKPTKGRKEGLGSMWNREMEVVPPPISPCTNPGHSKGRYLKQKINQGRAKWKTPRWQRETTKKFGWLYRVWRMDTSTLKKLVPRELVTRDIHLNFLLPTWRIPMIRT